MRIRKTKTICDAFFYSVERNSVKQALLDILLDVFLDENIWQNERDPRQVDVSLFIFVKQFQQPIILESFWSKEQMIRETGK